MFDESWPLTCRIQYIADHSDAMCKLAIDWDPDGIIGLSTRCLTEKVDITGLPYDLFEKFAKAMIKTACGNHIVVYSPLVMQLYCSSHQDQLR